MQALYTFFAACLLLVIIAAVNLILKNGERLFSPLKNNIFRIVLSYFIGIFVFIKAAELFLP